jgi:hypothetical protein
MANERRQEPTPTDEARDAERKADQETERREDEGHSQPESSAQKTPAPGPRP